MSAMSSEDSGNGSDSITNANTKMEDFNRISKNKSFEEIMDEYYDIFISTDGSELFACKFKNCPNIEKQESDIIKHLKQHFSDNGNPNPNSVNINLSDESEEKSVPIMIDTNSGVECINISDDDTVESNSNNKFDTNSGSGKDKNDNTNENWEHWVGIAFDKGKEIFFCKFNEECDFKTNLRMKIKTHISKHYKQEVGHKPEFNNEYEFWEDCLKDVFNTKTPEGRQSNQLMTESTQKPRNGSKNSSKRSSKLKSNSKTKSQTKGNTFEAKPHKNSFIADNRRTENSSSPQTPTNTSGLIDINFNHNNTILSLKGMASVKKLDEYIRCEVLNGLKYFCCNYNQKCEFKSKRSQETANHVHCAHLGFYLECVRPDCDKIFRTPGSWREHQKNHICNFGLYGYQRGVTGVCRNSHLLKFQEKVIVEDNHKAYKCNWKGCGFVTRQRTACKRHIHNTHVCPYRKNKQWKKELLKFMEIKSHMTEKPIPVGIKNETFYCSRPQCKAELANEADLRRHERDYCKYKITAKTVQNGRNTASKDTQKPKAVTRLIFSSPTSTYMPSTSGLNDYRNVSQDSNREQNSQNKKQIQENGHKIEDRRDSNGMQTNGQNPTDIQLKCEKYIKRKFYDGIHYILCNAPNCKFTTKVEAKIYEHITRMHSLHSQIKHKPKFDDNIPQLRKRSHSSLDSTDTIVSRKTRNSTDSHQSSQNKIQKTSEKPTQNSSQKIPQNSVKNNLSQISSKNTHKIKQNLPQKSSNSDLNNTFKDYYKVKKIDSEPFYFCEYPSDRICRFYSKTSKELFDHISQTHIVFRCDVSNCKKEFKTKSLLEVHKRNHICGFGIAGMKATGVCALENVRKYRREVSIKGVYRYECKVCQYKSEIKSAVLSHAHNRHVHPPPPPQ